ncbi:MAG: DUF192 domain-containing protein [Spirochaetaceae bacterium]|nr:DUF192 domain-containing protein [Spirochaetaceae bacterium]
MKYLFRKNFLLFIVILQAALVSCKDDSRLPTMELMIQRGDGSEVAVVAEIADTQETRNRGFMEREQIPDGTGMLFVFERDQILSFWMKNTPHPLSIAYIDSTGKIRDIYHMTPFSMANWTSTVSVRYALEVPQGWFEKESITVGDKVVIPGKTDK